MEDSGMKVRFFSLPFVVLALGCAASYNVGINGYSSTGETLQIPQLSSIYVVTDSNATNPFLEKEIAVKIQKLLTAKGYTVGTHQASYYLLFEYGIDSGRILTDAIPIHHPTIYGEYSTIHAPYYGRYVPYSELFYTRWLVLKLVDRNAYRDLHKAEPSWIGEVTSTGPSPDLREVINYMLIAAFEHFGQDTDRRVTKVIPKDDERVELLMER